MIEHYIDMPDGTQLRVCTDGHEAYPTRVVTQMEAIWVNQQLAIMGVTERVRGRWERNGS